jgi:type II secretory pathway pseudopilin PulG
VAIVLGTLVIVGILAAVAIPVILNQRAKSEAARITVAAPAKVAGWSRLTDAASLELEQQLISTPGPGTHVAGVYGTGGLKRAFFTASHAQLSFADRRGFLAGAENGAARTPEFTQVAFFDSDPGPLGGSMRCATLTANRVTVCLFADAGAYGTVTVFGPVDQGPISARTMREAVEHRA